MFSVDLKCTHRHSQGVQGCRCTPQSDKKISRHFCWNGAKMGLNLVRCAPADEIKGSWWQYLTHMTMQKTKKGHQIFGQEESVPPPPEKILATPMSAHD